MADFASSLPIRTEADGDVVAIISDATITSQKLKVNANGSIDVNATATDLDIRDLVFATDKVDTSGSTVELGATSLAALENITVSATNLDVRDLVFATDKVDVSGSTVTASITSPGTASNDYNTGASVAAAGTSTHTYTSTGNFYLKQFCASSSGKLKIVVKVNSVTKFVLFNSTSNPNMFVALDQPILATTGQTVTIERTNLDKSAEDVYSTISGYTV